jgi:FAD/FMN-containing dehydrogenase
LEFNVWKKRLCSVSICFTRKKFFSWLKDVLKKINQYNLPPFLTVLKLKGKKSIGTMSFPMPGYTLALDFPIRKGTYELLDALDRIIIKNNGRIYLAKDNRVSKEKFHQMYENEIKSFISSNNYRSLQSERVEI